MCVRVFWVLGDSASLLRSTESEAAGAADADRLFSRQGQLGDRKGETIESEREMEGRGEPQELKQTQDQHWTNEFIGPYSSPCAQYVRAKGGTGHVLHQTL